jgi:GLPGLI family protein
MKFKIAVFILCTFSCYSQSLIKLKVEYKGTVMQHPNMTIINSGKLFFSNDISYYTVEQQGIEEKNSKNKDSDIIDMNSKEDKKNFEIIVFNKDDKLIERSYESIFLKKFYSIVEKKPKISWSILKDKKKIGKFNCKKATTTFRGRTYTAWYSEEIPISSGPWKFSGLPGLILSIEDKEGVYKWTANKITYPYKGKEIDIKEISKEIVKNKSISYKDFDKIRIQAIKNKIETIKSRSSNRTGMRGGYSYSTFLEKEPINEWRTQTEFY